MSEYAVTGGEAGRGNLLKALAEAGFLIGLERNRYRHNSSSPVSAYWSQLIKTRATVILLQ